MASTSGGTGGKPNNSTSKIKVNLQKNKQLSEWQVKTKKGKSSNNSTSTSQPISPNLQHIMDNNPQLLPSGTQFHFNDFNEGHMNNSTDNIISNASDELHSVVMELDNPPAISSDNTETGHAIASNDSSLSYTEKLNSNCRDPNLIVFSDNFTGVPIIIVETISDKINIGKLHPMKVGKLFFNKFSGVLRIEPIGVRVKVTFDSIVSANTCLASTELHTMGLQAYIPSTLVYSFGVINLDVSFPEEDFWHGLESNIQIVNFRRIPSSINGSPPSPSKLVELKFLSPTLPEKISIYKVLFKVSPSIRSPVICKNCLRYGHTAKFCRGKTNCSHCGLPDHSIINCPTKEATDPTCFHCKGPHLATDRSCSEWSRQKNIKKVMATENVSFKDAVYIIKNNIVNKSASFSETVIKSSDNIVKESSNNVINFSDENFPNVSESHASFYKKNNSHNALRKKNNFTTLKRLPQSSPNNKEYSSPNGTFLKYMSENTYSYPKENSWVTSLANQLSLTLINDPESFSSQSSLNNLIESYVINFFSSIQNESQKN